MKANRALLLPIALLAACTTVPPEHRNLSGLVQTRDDRTARRFVIDLKNTSDRAWCIDDGAWPTEGGMMHFAGDTAWVDIHGKRYPSLDENRGYCAGQCTIRLAPGSTLHGQIPYSKFTFGESEAGMEKTLTMTIDANLCR